MTWAEIGLTVAQWWLAVAVVVGLTIGAIIQVADRRG